MSKIGIAFGAGKAVGISISSLLVLVIVSLALAYKFGQKNQLGEINFPKSLNLA